MSAHFIEFTTDKQFIRPVPLLPAKRGVKAPDTD